MFDNHSRGIIAKNVYIAVAILVLGYFTYSGPKTSSWSGRTSNSACKALSYMFGVIVQLQYEFSPQRCQPVGCQLGFINEYNFFQSSTVKFWYFLAELRCLALFPLLGCPLETATGSPQGKLLLTVLLSYIHLLF